MKLDALFSSLKAKEQELDEHERKRNERIQRLEDSVSALINRKTEEGELLVDLQSVSSSRLSQSKTTESRTEIEEEELSSSSDELTDLSQSSSLLESIDSAVSARAVSRERIQAETDALLSRVDEDGNKLVELPANHEEILSMLYNIQSIDRSDMPENCIEVYQKASAIISQNEKNKEEWRKIRELDRVIEAKELQLRAIESGAPSLLSSASSTDRPTFVTHYRKPASTVTNPEKVRRNIELAGNPVAKYSMVERLQQKDKDRLLALENDVDMKKTAYEIEMQKLAFVDEKLKAFVPKEKWEERSIQSYPTNLRQLSETSFATTRSMLTAPTIMQDAKPGEKELQAQKEAREARQRLDAINQSLMDLREKPVTPLSDFEIQKLLCDADETLRDSQAFIATALQEERTSALETAKELLARLESSLRDDEDTEEIMRQAEVAMKKYEALYEVEQEELKESPELIEEQERVNTLMAAYEAKEQEIETIMHSLDELEARTRQQLDELNFEEPALPPVQLEEQSIEEFERAIEKRVRNRVHLPEPRALLTAEEFPLTLQLLGERPRPEEDEAD